MPRSPTLAASLSCLLALLPVAALAYDEPVHALITRRSFPGRDAWLAEALAAPRAADHDAFRARFWTLASQHPDPALRAAFLARFPTAAALDAWSFKELLMLDPAATVGGLDFRATDATLNRAQLLPLASRWPDDDKRNRSRFFRDPQRQPVLAGDGQPTPYDPATLELGNLTGTSSQAHAHYGLLPGPLSDDPEVLKKDPRRFAIPPTVHSFGVEFGQLYFDLALLARRSGLPSAAWQEAAFEGASLHHLQDVANQIHTIEVGIYEFFEAAFLQSKLRDLRTLGGLLGRRASLTEIGLRLVTNHHLLLETLYKKRLEEAEAGRPPAPEVAAALARLSEDDAAFAGPARAAMEAARARPGGEGEVAALLRTLIDQSSQEGPEVYRLIWKLSAPTLRDGRGHEFDGAKGDDPDRFVDLSGQGAPALLSRFYTLEGAGLRRAATGVRLLQAALDAEAARDGAEARAIDRLLRLLLPYHRDAEARRAKYVPASVEAQSIAWGWPLGAAAAAALLVGLVRRLTRRRA